MSAPDPAPGGQFLRYVGVAVAAAGADWVVFAVALAGGAWHLHAQALARVAGGLCSFVANQRWSFQAGQGDGLRQARRFGALYAVSYVLSLSLLYLLVDLGGGDPYLGKLAADGLCFVFNFAVMRSWVFLPVTAR